MVDKNEKHQLHIDKLAVAILEHMIEPVLGKDAITQIKGGYHETELRQTLSQVLISTEKRIIDFYPDRQMVHAMLNLPLATLPSIAQAVRGFLDHSDDSELQKLISQQLVTDYPKFTQDQTFVFANVYIRVLREELVSAIPEMRQKLQALSTLSMDINVKHILDRLDSLIPTTKDLDVDQERSFDDYVDKMQDLIINHELKEKDVDSPEVSLAVSRTEAILKKLSSQNKPRVIYFLQRQGLLQRLGQYLVGVDLTKVQLQGKNLSGINFDRSDLSSSVFDEANLYESSFLGSILVNASFLRAKLGSSQFFSANLQRATLDTAELTGADLSSINAEKASFSNADMHGCYLMEAHLRGARLADANLRGAFILRADLSGADLTGCDLTGAMLDQTTFLDALVTPEQIRMASSSWGIIYADGRKDETKIPERRKSLILIVEDDLDIAEMLNAYFRVQGYNVFALNWGEDAVTFTWKYLPDLVILDIRLPDIDGYEIARRIRGDHKIAHIPFIFLTEKRERVDRLQGYELGADDYITKPFDVQDLRLRVRNVLNRNQRRAMTNPVSGLPEEKIVDELISERIKATDWALLAISIKNLDHFRERYGFVAADDVFRAVALMIQNLTKQDGNSSDHVGHLTSTEFVIITTTDKIVNLSNTIKDKLIEAIPYFYPIKDRNNLSDTKSIQIQVASISYGDKKFKTIDQLKTELWRKVRTQKKPKNKVGRS